MTWHTLKHTFASRLAMAGVTEGTIATLLRHSSTALVRRYAHLSPTHLQEAIEKVSSFGKTKSRTMEEARPAPVKNVEQSQGLAVQGGNLMKRSYWSFLKAVYASAYHAFEAGVTRDDVLREIEQP